MAYRDFDSGRDEMLLNRPKFMMGARQWTCRPSMPTKTLMGLADTDRFDDDADKLALIKNFFTKVLIKDDRAPFVEMLDSEPDEDGDDSDVVYVTIDQLVQAMEWLVAQYTGKAGAPVSPSLTTPESSGAQLRSISSVPESAAPAS